MAEVLVLAEHSDGEVKKVTGELLTLARQFGEPAAVWVGDGAEQGQPRLAEFGATKVYVATGADVNDYVTGPEADVLAQLVEQVSPAAVLMASTGQNKEVAAGSRSRPPRVCSATPSAWSPTMGRSWPSSRCSAGPQSCTRRSRPGPRS